MKSIWNWVQWVFVVVGVFLPSVFGFASTWPSAFTHVSAIYVFKW